MANKNQTNGDKQAKVSQGFIGNPEVFLNEERETLIHRMGEARIEMPINLYKKILGIPFTPKEPAKGDAGQRRSYAFGFTTRPAIYLTKDGQYLIHRVFGIRVFKSVNYYKKILGGNFEPKTQTQAGKA